MEAKQPEMKFWAVVELMGHQKMAGYVTEVPCGGDSFLRVDVPEVNYTPSSWESGAGQQQTIAGFTRLISPKAVYAINPCTEEIARAAAAQMRSKPIELYAIAASRPALPAADPMETHYPQDDDLF